MLFRSPAAVKQKINTALGELQNYYQGKGPAPTIDFSNLADQARAVGVPVAQGSDLTQSVTLGSNNTKSSSRSINFEGLRMVTILTSVGLLLVVAALSLLWRRYTALPSVLISVGIFIACIAITAYAVPAEAGHLIKFSSTANTFTSLGRDLVESIGKNLALRFGIVSGVCLVIGISARIWTGRLQKKLAAPQPQVSIKF